MGFLGAGFQSKSKYMFGKVNIQIKLVEGDSAGTVTAFYVSSKTNFYYYISLSICRNLKLFTPIHLFGVCFCPFQPVNLIEMVQITTYT